MRKGQPQWRWDVGAVDERKEHIELRHGRAGETPYESWLPVARIGKPKNHCFPVQWLVNADAVENKALIGRAREELDFYLVEKNEPDPWAYAVYHCNTGANLYSLIHSCYFPDGQGGERVSSRVVHISDDEAPKTFGESKVT
jgi:hypothetical protein